MSIRSHSRKWQCRDWQPIIVLVARIYLFCVGTRDSRVASYWIDTLVLKTKGNTYTTLLHHPFLFKGKINTRSRSSRKNFWRRCRGGSRKSRFDSRQRAISGAVAGEVRASQDLTPDNEPFLAPLPGSLRKKSIYQVPITIPISRITLFSICLSFSSPPHLKRFSKTFAFSSPLFRSFLFACF